MFGIPYDAIQVIYPQSKSVQSTGGKVMQQIRYRARASPEFL
jgi:hypothetical protein